MAKREPTQRTSQRRHILGRRANRDSYYFVRNLASFIFGFILGFIITLALRLLLQELISYEFAKGISPVILWTSVPLCIIFVYKSGFSKLIGLIWVWSWGRNGPLIKFLVFMLIVYGIPAYIVSRLLNFAEY